jgi:hypothetical protein
MNEPTAGRTSKFMSFLPELDAHFTGYKTLA